MMRAADMVADRSQMRQQESNPQDVGGWNSL